MYRIALKMLFNDRVKFLTLLIGLTFSVVLITQQGSIFCGLMLRTGSTINDTNVPIWVMDERVRSINDSIPIQESKLQHVRSVDGVEWAVPMLYSNISAKADTGETAVVNLIGLDDESLIGIPPNLKEGSYAALNEPEAVIISYNRRDRFGSPGLGDYFELNNRRARVVGLLDATRNFVPFPSVYTTYNKALLYIPPVQKYLSFVLVKAQPGYDEDVVVQNINRETGLRAFQHYDFFWSNLLYWAQNTGIPINFGITIVLGVLIGAAIAGQTLYTFMIENTRQFGTFKAIGLKNAVLIKMVLVQSVSVALISYGLGVGIMALLGIMIPDNAELAYYTPWQLPVIAFFVVVVFCILASLISIRRVLQVDPAIVFRG